MAAWLRKSPASYGDFFDNFGHSEMVDQEAGLLQDQEAGLLQDQEAGLLQDQEAGLLQFQESHHLKTRFARAPSIRP